MKRRVAGVTSVLDITGRIYTAEIRHPRSQDVPDYTLTCVVPVGTDGKIHISLSPVETGAMRVGDYYWRLTQNASSVISRVLEGKAKITV